MVRESDYASNIGLGECVCWRPVFLQQLDKRLAEFMVGSLEDGIEGSIFEACCTVAK